jgi:hypothetical protein
VRIESIVFHGFRAAEGRRAGVALQQELTRLLGQHGARELAASGAREVIDAGFVALSGRPEATGRHVARAVHRGLRT